jgi:hypothetical protein
MGSLCAQISATLANELSPTASERNKHRDRFDVGLFIIYLLFLLVTFKLITAQRGKKSSQLSARV